MYGGGYYPIMSDTEWRSAPWNQEEPEYETCPDCDGDGGEYYDADGEVISKEEYLHLSDFDKLLYEFVECEKCGGSGKIIKEDDEPDWDAIYEDRNDK